MGKQNRKSMGVVPTSVSRAESEILCEQIDKKIERNERLKDATEDERHNAEHTMMQVIERNVRFLVGMEKDAWFIKGFVWGLIMFGLLLVIISFFLYPEFK